MIVLLPVSRYRVRYQVASGRPYSFFERFILEGVRDGYSSLESLEQTLRVHRRVLIEGLVTLVQAGWVAIDRVTHKLVPTKAGLHAIDQPDELPKNIVVLEQTDHVIGERVQGQVAKGTEVTFTPRSELRSHMQRTAEIKARDLPHPLDPGILIPFLRTNDLEWIRSCGPIDIIRDGADFAVVDVDTSLGVITGIPARWIPLLRDDMLDHARSKERELAKAGTIYSSDKALTKLVRRNIAVVDSAEAADPDEWLLEPATDRVIIGDEHHALLANWLETVHSYVCIVSGALDGETVARLDGPIRSAVKRGVVVDVIWGSKENRGDDTHRRGLDILKKIEWDSQQAKGRGRLSLGRKAADTNARILFGDASEIFETVIGSCDWLSSDSGQDVSLLFRERGPVARIARLLGDLAAADEKLSIGVGLTCLRHVAEDLGRQTVEANEQQAAEREMGRPVSGMAEVAPPVEPRLGSIRARIVVGRQNHAILPTLGGNAQHSLVVAGHRWGRDADNAFNTLRDALERGCRRVEVRYSEDADPGSHHDELAGGLAKLGGVIRKTPHFHARVAVADDDTVAVTSFDWLCPATDRQLATISDLGFTLRGNGIGLALLDRIGIPRAQAPVPLDAEYLTGFRIERLRSVKRVEWRLGHEAAPGWHVLVGDNGTGKTSILRALALALIGSDDAQKLRQDWSTWLRGGETMAELEVSLQRTPDTAMAGSPPTSRSVKLVWERTAKGSTTLRASPGGQNGVLSAGYGPFRRFTGGDPEYERQLALIPGLARHVSLFDERVALTESLAWLRDLKFKALENDPESTLLIDRVTKLVNESGVLPCGIRLARVTSDTVVFRDPLDYEYGIEELSDGYRSVLSLTFDIVRQLAIRFGAARVFDYEDPHVVSAPAIVLIDEVDAHLHPAWQRTVGQWFRQHFPRIQFIVTTHSPLICQAAQVGSVYRLPDPTDESDVGGMVDGPALARLVYGNVLEAYASGAFGEGITRSDTSQGFLHRLAELNRKELTSGLSQNEQKEQETLRATLPLAAHVATDKECST